ncbi:MAG TPA: hypothetical protein VLW86_06700 [Syntrophorhabdales bacterium]|nr:hypothetical protein [Syntrophorhabdales bacterium]
MKRRNYFLCELRGDGNYFLRGEKFSYDDFEAFRLLLWGGLVAGRSFILLGCRMILVLLMTVLLPLPVGRAVLSRPGPVLAEVLNREYGTRRKAVV